MKDSDLYLPNFTVGELRCKGSGMLVLAPGFGEALQALRDEFGGPMSITSACRSKSYNKAVGGHPRSMHVWDYPHWPTGGCCAVDVRTSRRPKEYRDALVELAWKRGWSIGDGPTFVHLDLRVKYTKLPQARFNYA
jgi:hypothetical protein